MSPKRKRRPARKRRSAVGGGSSKRTVVYPEEREGAAPDVDEAVREAEEMTARPKKRLGKKKRRSTPQGEGNWSEIIYSRESMDMHDPAERREFVNACLQQITEAQVEMDNLEYEYRTVTAYLRDLEELDALPQKQHDEVAKHAQRILDAGRGREQFYNREIQMGQNDFERMHEMAPKTKETIKKMRDAEEYQKKIRNDLKRLDNERNAYDYRLDEIDSTVHTSQVLLIFIAVLLCAVVVVLFVTGKVFKLNVTYGYMLAALFAAVGVTYVYIRSQNANKERKGVVSGINRLILLQNTVKIRYVNNQNLLNYMTLKYNVKSSEELQRMSDLYEKEKDDRAKLRGSEKTMMESQRELLQMLRNFRLQYPDVWMKQISALADPREEVEVRHQLNQQRQSLRERMDYNERKVKGRARDEIERLARDYPEYADEILDMVSRRSLQ